MLARAGAVTWNVARTDTPGATEAKVAGPEARAAIGDELRRRVQAGHSVDSWAAAVLRELGGASTEGAATPSTI